MASSYGGTIRESASGVYRLCAVSVGCRGFLASIRNMTANPAPAFARRNHTELELRVVKRRTLTARRDCRQWLRPIRRMLQLSLQGARMDDYEDSNPRPPLPRRPGPESSRGRAPRAHHHELSNGKRRGASASADRVWHVRPSERGPE